MSKLPDAVSAAIVEATGRIVAGALHQTLGSNQHNEAKEQIAKYVEVTMSALTTKADALPK